MFAVLEVRLKELLRFLSGDDAGAGEEVEKAEDLRSFF